MGYVFDALNRSNSDEPNQRRPEGGAEALASPGADDTPGLSLIRADADASPGPQGPGQPGSAAAATEKVSEPVDDRVVGITAPASIMAEEYRSIRTGLLARWQNKRHLVHTITSATPQEGKTITSLNLGLSFAELRNRRTIVVEADLRLPQFNKLLNLPADGPGMVDVLLGSTPLEEATFEVGDNRMHLIPAGRRVGNDAVQMLSASPMGTLLKTLRGKYDHVIIDTPPVIELADAGIVGAQSDDVLMIVRMGRTPKTMIEQAIRTLSSYNAPVAGIIATDHQRRRRRYYSYRYGYRYNYRYYYNHAV
ncbi:MAG: CpsD/CapB family tyrosine-protein kinase [Phycisphaeraceae bacterium]